MILTRRSSGSGRTKICASGTFSATGLTRAGLGFKPDLRDERLATNRLSHDYLLPDTTPWLLASSGCMKHHDVDNHT